MSMSENQKMNYEITDNQSALMDFFSMFTVLFYKVLRINLVDDSYEIIKINENEKSKLHGYNEKVSVWMHDFAANGLIHEDDLKSYTYFTDINLIREHFKNSSEPLRYRYRRKCNDVFRWVVMELIKSNEYTNENQLILLYVRDIHDNFIAEVSRKRAMEQMANDEKQLLETSILLMKDAYLRIGCIELDNNSMITITCPENESELIELFERDYHMGVYEFAKKYAAPEYYETILNVMLPERLEELVRNYVRNVDFSYQRFEGDKLQWVRAEFVPMPGFDNGDRRIMWYVKNIANEKALENRLSYQLMKTNADMNLKLETILEGIQGGFKICLADGRQSICHMSKGAADIQGYTVEEFMIANKGSALNNIYPSDLEKVRKKITRDLSKGNTYSVKYRVKTKNGSIKWVTDNGTKIVDENGATYLYSITIDVTESENTLIKLCNVSELKDRLNELLLNERQQYRWVFEQNCEYSFYMDVSNGIISENIKTKSGHDVMKYLGVTIPVDYDDFVWRCFKAYDLRILNDKSIESLSHKAFIEKFEKGEKNLAVEYYNPVSDKYMRSEVFMSVNVETRHIQGFVYAVDNTKLRKEEELHKQNVIAAQEMVRNTNEAFNRSIRSEKEKASVLKAIGNIYFCIYYISLSDGSFKQISAYDKSSTVLNDISNFQEYLNYILENDIYEESKGIVSNFIQISLLGKRLGNKRIYSIECRSKLHGWIRMSFVSATKNKNNMLTHVLLVAERIDPEN